MHTSWIRAEYKWSTSQHEDREKVQLNKKNFFFITFYNQDEDTVLCLCIDDDDD